MHSAFTGAKRSACCDRGEVVKVMMNSSLGIGCLILLLLIPAFTDGQQTDQEKKMMEGWAKLAVPAEHHKHIAQFQGNWNVTLKSRIIATDTLEESSGSCEKKMVLGGRYLSEHCNTKTKSTPAKSSEGIGYLGYDNFKKSYISIWMSSDNTMVTPLYGTCDGTGKVITVTGNYADPVSGKERQARWTWTVIDQNRHALKIDNTDPEGKDNRSIEVTYTRK